MTSSALANKRILVVEDEFLIGMLIEDTLIDFGCTLVGPKGSLPEALEAAETEDFDAALLDVNLRGEKVYPVAEILSARGIPFLLLSGYGDGSIPEDRPEWRACSKPFTADELIAALERRLAQTP